jgi:hypothetical protein
MSDGSPQAPSHAERSATDEILALEKELEREGQQAAIALERMQQQLEDIEAAEPGGPRVTSASDASEVGLAGEDGQRERVLLAERDEAVSSLRAALVALERAEAGVPRSEQQRQEIEEQIRTETEESIRAELEADHKLFAAEAAEQVERARAEASERARRESEAARSAVEERLRAELSLREQALRLERESAARAAEESEARLAAIEAALEAAAERVEAAEASVAAQAEEASRRLSERERELQHEARGLAAAWLHGQVESIRRDAEEAAEERLAAREREPAQELEAAGSALRSAEMRPDRASRFAVVEEKVKALERRASSIFHPRVEPDEDTDERDAVADAVPSEDPIDINAASFEQLRRLGMSVTQSTRVIAYRNRAGGFGELDDLDSVPGFTTELLAELKARLTA